MVEKINAVIARLLFAVPMGYFGINNILTAHKGIDDVPDYFPFPIVWVYIVGVSFLAASVGIIINQYAKWAYAGLSLLLLIISVLVAYPTHKNGGVTHFMMDIALTGAAFYMFLKEKR